MVIDKVKNMYGIIKPYNTLENLDFFIINRFSLKVPHYKIKATHFWIAFIATLLVSCVMIIIIFILKECSDYQYDK